MSRGPVSVADTDLIGCLGNRGVEVSAAQLERWRTAGVLPRNERRGVGRGAGSVSRAPAESVAIAEALARATRRGRPLHEAVLQVFTADPRFRLKIFLVTPRLPLPEHAVRAALGWFIRYRENSVQRRIERAVAAAPSADDAEDIAAELAQVHYLGVFRRHRKEPGRSVVTAGYPLTGQKEALGLAVQTVASLLGQEAVGSDRFAEALGCSLGYATKHQDEIETLARFMAAENIRRELTGQPAIGADRPKHTIDTDIEAIHRIDFAVICRVRDVLALLAEASMIYEAVKASLSSEPMVHRLLEFFTSSLEAHHLVSAAAPLASTAPADSWKWMASVIVMICSDADELADFEEAAKGIDFTLDDIRNLGLKRR
jgi:hypothetical protein